jgi:hypothetical protein
MNPKHPVPHQKSHHPNSTITTVPRSQISKRRSSRMLLNASVGLTGEDRLNCSFTIPAKAFNLNQHGAAVQLSRDLIVGSIVMVRK